MNAEKILIQLKSKNTKLGDLRAIAKEIKIDHQLALELWTSKQYFARLLAILILDKKLLNEELINNLITDIDQHNENEKLQLIDWLMANQLTKDKMKVALIETWSANKMALKRRIYWYYKGRLRWTGKIMPDSEYLLSIIEKEIEKETHEVQWAMNFTACWIGVFQKEYRKRCIDLGLKTGLYKGKMVAKGCTPEYLPEFIAIECSKRNL